MRPGTILFSTLAFEKGSWCALRGLWPAVFAGFPNVCPRSSFVERNEWLPIFFGLLAFQKSGLADVLRI